MIIPHTRNTVQTGVAAVAVWTWQILCRQIRCALISLKATNTLMITKAALTVIMATLMGTITKAAITVIVTTLIRLNAAKAAITARKRVMLQVRKAAITPIMATPSRLHAVDAAITVIMTTLIRLNAAKDAKKESDAASK